MDHRRHPLRDGDTFGRKHSLISAWIKFAICAVAGAVIGVVLVVLLAGA